MTIKRQPGVVIGTVKSLNDPKGEGRIEVEFPWLGRERRTRMAAVAAPLAGSQRGAFFMPEKNEEVLVAFEHGHQDHPYIVGFLWNGRDRPPETDPQNRVILTPGGHTLRFEDRAPAKKVILKSSIGYQITLDESPPGQSSTPQSVVIETPGGLKLTLDDVGKAIKLEGGGRTLTMQGGQVLIT